MVYHVIMQADCFMDTENVQHDIEKAFAFRTHIIIVVSEHLHGS